MEDGAWKRGDVSMDGGQVGAGKGEGVPFLSSIVTVSFAHFMRNLEVVEGQRWCEGRALRLRAQLRDLC